MHLKFILHILKLILIIITTFYVLAESEFKIQLLDGRYNESVALSQSHCQVTQFTDYKSGDANNSSSHSSPHCSNIHNQHQRHQFSNWPDFVPSNLNSVQVIIDLPF